MKYANTAFSTNTTAIKEMTVDVGFLPIFISLIFLVRKHSLEQRLRSIMSIALSALNI